MLSGAISARLDIQEVSLAGAIATATAAETLRNIAAVSAFVDGEKDKLAGKSIWRREQAYTLLSLFKQWYIDARNDCFHWCVKLWRIMAYGKARFTLKTQKGTKFEFDWPINTENSICLRFQNQPPIRLFRNSSLRLRIICQIFFS